MRDRLYWLIPLVPVLWLVAGTLAFGGWTLAQLPPGHGEAIRPVLLACAADLRRQHPQAKPLLLSLRQYDTVENEVSGNHVKWTLSGTLTRSSDDDLYVFDCTLDQRGSALTVTYSHASLWWTPPPD